MKRNDIIKEVQEIARIITSRKITTIHKDYAEGRGMSNKSIPKLIELRDELRDILVDRIVNDARLGFCDEFRDAYLDFHDRCERIKDSYEQAIQYNDDRLLHIIQRACGPVDISVYQTRITFKMNNRISFDIDYWPHNGDELKINIPTWGAWSLESPNNTDFVRLFDIVYTICHSKDLLMDIKSNLTERNALKNTNRKEIQKVIQEFENNLKPLVSEYIRTNYGV